jgi:hypothetical protein
MIILGELVNGTLALALQNILFNSNDLRATLLNCATLLCSKAFLKSVIVRACLVRRFEAFMAGSKANNSSPFIGSHSHVVSSFR